MHAVQTDLLQGLSRTCSAVTFTQLASHSCPHHWTILPKRAWQAQVQWSVSKLACLQWKQALPDGLYRVTPWHNTSSTHVIWGSSEQECEEDGWTPFNRWLTCLLASTWPAALLPNISSMRLNFSTRWRMSGSWMSWGSGVWPFIWFWLMAFTVAGSNGWNSNCMQQENEMKSRKWCRFCCSFKVKGRNLRHTFQRPDTLLAADGSINTVGARVLDG